MRNHAGWINPIIWGTKLNDYLNIPMMHFFGIPLKTIFIYNKYFFLFCKVTDSVGVNRQKPLTFFHDWYVWKILWHLNLVCKKKCFLSLRLSQNSPLYFLEHWHRNPFGPSWQVPPFWQVIPSLHFLPKRARLQFKTKIRIVFFFSCWQLSL